MRIEEIARELDKVGLAREEAEVYLRLLRTGPAKVSTLSSYFEMSRSKLYRVLDELAERDIVTKSLARPTLYEAEDPEDVIQAELEDLRQRERRVEELLDTTIEPLRRLKRADGPSTEHHWKRIEGSATIYRALRKAATSAQEKIRVVSNHELSLRLELPMVEKLWKVATGRAHEGVTVEMLFDLPEDPFDQLPSWIVEEPLSIRQLDERDPLHFTIFDGEEVILWARTTDKLASRGAEAVALWTNAPGVAAPLRTLFRRLWPESQPIEG